MCVAGSWRGGYTYRDAVPRSSRMSLNGKANLLLCHDKASKLEVQTFKSARLKCEGAMSWVPILGAVLQQQLRRLGPAPGSANIKASAVNSNFRCSATLLSIFFFIFFSQVTAAWQALPGHCPAVSGAAQQTESALQREAAAYRRGAVSANAGTVPKVGGEYSAASAESSASGLVAALGFCCCCCLK